MRTSCQLHIRKPKHPSIEPGKDDGHDTRLHIPGRNNLLKAGTVLQNRYRVLDIRGVGGMSTVYKARDLRFTSVDRLCAVKEMFNSAEDAKLGQVRLANFQREASLLATLTHSAIPRIYDYFEQQGTIYLVLELIHGEDLETLLSQNGAAVRQEKIVDWALALCSVIAYLHNQRPEPIIFRDLKPSNIMIRSEDDALMLVDFGIARSFAPQQKGTMIGTEGYAPPEQYKGIADARGDIYALGATLHHLATGSDPRPKRHSPSTSGRRANYNPALSPDLEELILRCVSYSPAERPQSAEDVRQSSSRSSTAPMRRRTRALRRRRVPPGKSGRCAADRGRSAGSNMLDGTHNCRNDESAIHEVLPAEPSGGNPVNEKQLDWSLKTGDEMRGFGRVRRWIDIRRLLRRKSVCTRRRRMALCGGGSRASVGSCPGRPFIAEMVVFGSEDKTVYAVSRSSGRAIWSFELMRRFAHRRLPTKKAASSARTMVSCTGSIGRRESSPGDTGPGLRCVPRRPS